MFAIFRRTVFLATLGVMGASFSHNAHGADEVLILNPTAETKVVFSPFYVDGAAECGGRRFVSLIIGALNISCTPPVWDAPPEAPRHGHWVTVCTCANPPLFQRSITATLRCDTGPGSPIQIFQHTRFGIDCYEGPSSEPMPLPTPAAG